jgi:hypothetical protein
MASNNGDRDVLGSLPNSRPQRRSAKRDRARAATKPKAAAPEAPAMAAASRTQTAKKAPAAKRTALPPPAPIPPAGYATPRRADERPGRADLVATAFQAVGELAQIGIAAGGRALKSVVDRVPKP